MATERSPEMISTDMHNGMASVAERPTHVAHAKIWRDQPQRRARINTGRIARERAKSLPGRAWMIAGAGALAWAIVAVPAYMIFG